MDIKIPVTWEVSGFVHIDASSIEEAIQKFEETSDHIRLPEGEYVDGSFQITCKDQEFIEMFNPMYDKEDENE